MGFASLVLPRIATGVGGLDWDEVHPLVVEYLGDLPMPVLVYTRFDPGQAAHDGLQAASPAGRVTVRAPIPDGASRCP